jgi:hypothetical protein
MERDRRHSHIVTNGHENARNNTMFFSCSMVFPPSAHTYTYTYTHTFTYTCTHLYTFSAHWIMTDDSGILTICVHKWCKFSMCVSKSKDQRALIPQGLQNKVTYTTYQLRQYHTKLNRFRRTHRSSRCLGYGCTERARARGSSPR